MNAQIVLENVGVRLPNRTLFEEVNWTLYDGMRVTLAGRNGSGKSTLLKILAGHGDPSLGTRNVVGGRRLRIGMLDQSLLDSAVSNLHESKQQNLSALHFLSDRLAVSLGDEISGPEEVVWEVRKILAGLGFPEPWMGIPMTQLSGGWLLRVFIADALLKKPDVLLLDEPTNHLDISSIQWLEEFLQREYKGSLVLITHDVTLQRRTTDSLAVLHGGRFFFRKHQSDYLTFRESLGDEKRVLQKQIDALEKKIDENLDFARRFRAKAQTAARAQSKLKAAETMTDERNGLKDQLARVQGASYNLRFRFRHSGDGSKFPLAIGGLHFRYSDEAPLLVRNVSFDVSRGQRIAILGDNGTGKTTLLNLLAGRLTPISGQVMRGHGVELGYFGQHQLDELSLENTVLDNLRTKAVGLGIEELRGLLGAFGFGGDEDVDKKAKVLSGGERARLALLRILTTRINLCLLDEPTNHLDIETKALLKQAIQEFNGTIVLVSHDREFVSEIANRIIYLDRDHRMTDHLGNLDSFFEKFPQFVRHLEGRAKPSAPKAEDTASKAESSSGSSPAAVLSFEERKQVRNQTKSLEKKVAQIETELERIGVEKSELNGRLESTEAASERTKITAQLESLEKQLHTLMADWERMSSELERLRALVK